MACPERATDSRIVESERLLCCLPDAWQADDEQVVVDKDEMLRPPITAWIEETIGSPTRPMGDLLPLG